MPKQYPWQKKAARLPASGLLFDENPYPMWIYDIKTLAFLAVNRAAIARYGYSREEFLSMTLRDIRPEEDIAALEKILGSERVSGQYYGEWRHRTKSGQVFNAQVESRRLRWQGREVALVSARDISQERKARDEVFALWRQHLQLQEIINQSPAVALMWSANPGLPVKFVSENISQFGYTPGQFAQGGLRYRDIIHPEDLQHVMDEIERHAHRETTHFEQEYRILTSEGEARWVECRVWIHRAGSGQVIGYSGVLLDINERRKAEESLRYQAALMANVSDAIISTDMAFNVLSWNPAAETIYQWKTQEVIGRPLHLLTEPDYLGQDANDVLRQFNSVGYWGGVVSHKRKDGQRIVLDARISMVMDNKGQPIGFVAACRDISEKIKIERALRDSEQQYRAIFEQAAVGVSRTNIAGIFTDVNEKFCQITGYPRQQLIGRSYQEITDPEDIEKNEQTRQELLNKKKTSATIEKRYIRKDGSRSWVNLTLSYIDTGPENEPFLLAISEDINVRKIHERDLQALYESGAALNHLKTPEAIASKIIEILNNRLGWDHCGVWLREQGSDKIRILAYSVPEEEVDPNEERQKSQNMVSNMDSGMTGWAMRCGHTIRQNNVESDPHYAWVHPNIHSGLYVPMMSDGQAIGCIMVESHEADAFDEDDQRLLETLANQARIAFENASLLAAEKNRANQLQAVILASQAISGTLNSRALLDTILETARHAIPATERGSIMLMGEDKQLHISGSLGYQDLEVQHAAIPPEVGYAAQAYREQRSILLEDASQHPDREYFARLPETYEVLSAISTPLMVKGKPIGVISLDNCSRTGAFTENDLQLLATFAASAAISIENARLFEQTQVRLRNITALRAIDNAINASTDLKAILNVILEQTCEQLGCDAAAVLAFNPVTMTLETQASRGFRGRGAPQIRFRLGEDIASQSIIGRNTIVINDFQAAGRPGPRTDFFQEEGFVTYACAPMITKGDIKGLLEVFHRAPLQTNSEWLAFLEMLAGQAAIAIENVSLYRDLQRSNMELTLAYDATIEGWAQALELRDQETEGHSRRVTNLTLELARKLGVSDEELVHIRRGALLHDIGKMGIPDSILHKPGPLTPQEWQVMRQHPLKAFELLSKIPYLERALEIPHFHHER